MKVFFTFCFLALIGCSSGQDLNRPDTVEVQSGSLKLKALLWHPRPGGKLPAVIFCHGAYASDDTTYDPVSNTSLIGSIFARHGYVFLGLLRRGTGLSKGQGVNSADLMANAFKEHGQQARNKVQLEHLETDQLQDMVAGLSFLRNRNDIDANRIAVVGHSYGGSLALLVAEHEPGLKAVIVFSGAGYSWDRSPELRSRLITATHHISAPIMIIHAHNDYSLHPGYSLDSLLTSLHKPHVLKIYPAFGKTNRDAHNMVFLGTQIWESDVFKFLDGVMKN